MAGPASTLNAFLARLFRPFWPAIDALSEPPFNARLKDMLKNRPADAMLVIMRPIESIMFDTVAKVNSLTGRTEVTFPGILVDMRTRIPEDDAFSTSDKDSIQRLRCALLFMLQMLYVPPFFARALAEVMVKHGIKDVSEVIKALHDVTDNLPRPPGYPRPPSWPVPPGGRIAMTPSAWPLPSLGAVPAVIAAMGPYAAAAWDATWKIAVAVGLASLPPAAAGVTTIAVAAAKKKAADEGLTYKPSSQTTSTMSSKVAVTKDGAEFVFPGETRKQKTEPTATPDWVVYAAGAGVIGAIGLTAYFVRR